MKKILLIEDNPDNADLVFAFLDDLYDIHACDDGPSALALVDSGYAPDLVLCDISLPGMDGLQVLAGLRERAPTAQVPVVALTSHAMKGDQERFIAGGFDAYISKPILDDVALIEPIERLLT